MASLSLESYSGEAPAAEPSDTDNIGPLGQVSSSLIGAVVTSLLVTPFDVVKTRLQAQQKPISPASTAFMNSSGLMDQFCHCRNAFTASADFNRHMGRGSKCNGVFPAPVPRFQRAVTTSSKVMWPGNRHTIFEHARQCPWYQRTDTVKFSGTVDALLRISRTEGTRSLWSGLSPTLLMSVPATILYFTVYDNLRTAFIRRLHLAEWAAGASAGATARLLAATVVSPLELVRTKVQSERLDYKQVYKAVLADIHRHGVRSLWRGWAPTVLRDVPFSCIYWMCYETMKKRLIRSPELLLPSDGAIGERMKPRFISGPQSFAAGVVSGTVAAVLTLPFDVVKTYRQMELGLQHNNYNSRHASSSASDSRTFVILQQIYQQQGFRALFAGIVPRIAKVAPACGIMISSFELGKRYFFQRKFTKQRDDAGGVDFQHARLTGPKNLSTNLSVDMSAVPGTPAIT